LSRQCSFFWTVSQGNSQSGNFLRSFIHLGFNQDEAGRIVFDGSNPNVAVRLLAMNIRFAAPSGAAAMYEAGSDGIVNLRWFDAIWTNRFGWIQHARRAVN